jgi:hypothetical protein
MSVLTTLRDALLLGVRYFWLLLALSILVALPTSQFEIEHNEPKARMTGLQPLVGLMVLAAALVLVAMKNAAILGLLSRSPSDARFWSVIIASIRASAATLVRVELMLWGITILAIIPIGLFVRLVGSVGIAADIFVILFAILELLILKYSLADPLVVVEGISAWDALKKSWNMTKGHFSYVASCLILLAAGQYVFKQLVQQTLPGLPFSYPRLAGAIATSWVESFWVLTAWCMYQRIKNAEPPTSPPTPRLGSRPDPEVFPRILPP